MIFRSSERQENETRRAGLGFISHPGPCCVTNASTQFLCFEECRNGPFFVGSLDFFSQNCSQEWLLQPEKDLLETTLIKTLRRGFLTALAFFSLLFFDVTVACIAGTERGGERWKMEEGIGERRKETPLLVPFAFLSKSKTSNNYMDHLQS